MKLKERQSKIINMLQKSDFLSPGDIHENLDKEMYSRSTINRDLKKLLENNIIIKQGSGRTTKYSLNQSKLLKEFDVNEYFKHDFRTNIITNFNMNVFADLKGLLKGEEKQLISELNKIYKNKIFGQTETGIKKEFERLTIEFSWKSSSMEGNTYTLLETERLIKEKSKAEGHSDSEAEMILNHKKTLGFILESPEYFQEISLFKLKELHYLLTSGLEVTPGVRKTMVGITGTNYLPLDNEHTIKEALEYLFIYLNSNVNPVEKALVAVAIISYIQPFEDGNKRTARMLANAILIANNLIPVSFVGVDNIEYKKAIILFYEQNSIVYLKQLFLEQYELATKKYF